MKKYITIGIKAEKELKNYFEQKGYLTERTKRNNFSKSYFFNLFDLISLKGGGEKIFIQVRTCGKLSFLKNKNFSLQQQLFWQEKKTLNSILEFKLKFGAPTDKFMFCVKWLPCMDLEKGKGWWDFFEILDRGGDYPKVKHERVEQEAFLCGHNKEGA